MNDQSIYAPGLYPPALEPAQINMNPGPEYDVDTRLWQGCPTLARTPKGRLYAGWYSGGIKEPDEENYNLLVYSDDNGDTWSKPVMIIASVPEQRIRCMDIQLWVDPSGKMWVFWTQTRDSTAKNDAGQCLKFSDSIFGTFAITTSDPDVENPVYSKPRRLSDGFLRCRPTVLTSGKWIMCPYDWMTQKLAYCTSVDQGETWQRYYGPVRCDAVESLRTEESREKVSFDEQMVVQLKDGTLWMLSRTNLGALGQTFSHDDGVTWTPSELSPISNPSARIWIDRLPSGNLLLINHYEFTGRSHMTALISEDDGLTWPHRLLLDERMNVSYPDAVVSPDGMISVLHDCGRCGNGEKEIILSQFYEDDVLAGKLVTKGSRLRHIVSKA